MINFFTTTFSKNMKNMLFYEPFEVLLNKMFFVKFENVLLIIWIFEVENSNKLFMKYAIFIESWDKIAKGYIKTILAHWDFHYFELWNWFRSKKINFEMIIFSTLLKWIIKTEVLSDTAFFKNYHPNTTCKIHQKSWKS